MDFSDKIIDKKEELLDEFENLTLKEISIRIKEMSFDETDLVSKIACLAARVSVLNKRIQEIVNDNTINDNTTNDNIKLNTPEKSDNIVDKLLKPSEQSIDTPIEWVRVQIKETAEVNGVRFPSGIQIDVTNEDAQKMIEGGKAILLEDGEDKEKQ